MSVHVVTAPVDDLRVACETHLRLPSNVTGDPSTGQVSFHFDPDLTPEEASTLDALDHALASLQPMTPTGYAAVREQMQTLRALRQLGRNAFMGLTDAERHRMLYDAFTATTIVLLSMLRDE